MSTASRLTRAAFLAFLALPPLASGASRAGDISGRLEFTARAASSPADSLAAAFASADYTGFLSNARLRWDHRWGDFSAELHYRISAETGGGLALSSAMSQLLPPPPPGNLLNLEWTTVNTANQRLTHGIDRLSFSYSSPSMVLRIGRQALTWGAGTVFHPMDLVAPFSPAARDTEFKPGVDMVYLQWLMDNGDDLELIGVPRRAVAGGPVSADASTFALRYRTTLGDLGAEMVLARDHGDTTAGLGLSGALGGAAWNLEVVPTRLANGTVRTSGLANISTATRIMGRTGLLFAEYFHNGFGLDTKGLSLAGLTPDLADRLGRGQVFNVGRDYLAFGLSLEVSPLVNVSAGSILSLTDRSRLSTAQLNWSLSDNANLILGAQLPGGARGTEFGGLPATGAGAPYAMPEKSVYLLFRQYF